MAEPILSFFAEQVRSDTTQYTPTSVVYLIAFGTGDPEDGGHAWSFSRSFDDDWGVCTVREIQRAVVYGGIERFRLRRSSVECTFDLKAAQEVGFSALRITFEIDEKAWAQLTATARVAFRDCPYFILEEEPASSGGAGG